MGFANAEGRRCRTPGERVGFTSMLQRGVRGSSVAAAALIAFAGCVSEDFAEGQFTCSTVGASDECPDGLVCAEDLRCRSRLQSIDGGVGGDGSIQFDGSSGGSPGGSSGAGASAGTGGQGAAAGSGGGGPCAQCTGGQVCFNDACCTPQDPCATAECGQYDDGCGQAVSCAPCDPPRSCKSGKCCPPRNPSAAAAATPASTTGAPVCNPFRVAALDGQFATLTCVTCSYTSVQGLAVTSCLAADFGVVANLDPLVITARPDGGGDPACQDICIGTGCDQGHYFYVFRSATSPDSGTWTPVTQVQMDTLNAKSYSVNVGAPTRYVIVCRGGAGKNAANVAIDAIESTACP